MINYYARLDADPFNCDDYREEVEEFYILNTPSGTIQYMITTTIVYGSEMCVYNIYVKWNM